MAKRILLADDSITIQKVVELTFSDGDYEVTAVNNGAKAIQKLSEMRPDIILSDIIMPEKNGYEVCEYVKSHPEFRNIPVVLLTGTFEPFDPDRADKAGCDAVVTKPFESQSLIHKVEELVEQARSQAPTAPAASPFAGESPFAAEPAPPPPAQFATGAFHPQGEVFGGPAPAPVPPSSTTEMPFETPPAAGGETRAFPKMSFDDLKKMANEPAGEPQATGGETRAFPRMTFDEVSPAPPPMPPVSPWDEQAPAGGETRAIPKMSFEDMKRMAEPTPPPTPPSAPPPTTPEPSPWDSGPQVSSAAGDTMTPFGGPTAPPPSPMTGPSPWDESAQPGFGGETRALPRMSFDDLEKMASEMPSPLPPAPEPPSWTPPEPPRFEMGGGEELPFGREPVKAAEEPAVPKEPAPTAVAAAPAATTGELSEEQIDRIARRVVQLMSEQVVRNIAWEVIPDLAEMVVKERIRQLESE